MQVQQINISTITPYKHNNRKHSDTQIKRIAEAIKNFGWTQPLVLDSKNEIIIGHGRYFAAQRLGIKEVPAVVLNGKLTETQIKALRILDNKLQNDSEWDFESLGLELTQLEEMDFELEPWGLDELLIRPDILDNLDLGPEDRESDFSRTFTLTKDQAERVDEAVAVMKGILPDEDGNINGRAITEICVFWMRNRDS